MAKASNLFVNLPVKDLERSKAFFTALGFRINPQFTDENAASIVLGDHLFAMLLTETFFRNFSAKPIVLGKTGSETIIALSVDSRREVDELVDKALAAGGNVARHSEDLDFMFSRSFEDPDGHIWEILWMDPAHIQEIHE